MFASRWMMFFGLATFVCACGGSQQTDQTQTTGETSGVMPTELSDAGMGDAMPADAGPPPAVTFHIVNSAKTDLVFSVEKGWYIYLSAYSGKPPHAKPIVMFPKSCTASCDTADEERCPYCPEPEGVKEVKAAEQRVVVPAGESYDVPWDGQIFVYERTSGTTEGKQTTCNCYRNEPAPAETYTVRGCGLRLTDNAKTSSQLQCVFGEMTLPAAEPLVVTLELGEPQHKRHHRRR